MPARKKAAKKGRRSARKKANRSSPVVNTPVDTTPADTTPADTTPAVITPAATTPVVTKAPGKFKINNKELQPKMKNTEKCSSELELFSRENCKKDTTSEIFKDSF